ncbi:hypothetical protein OG349_04520 [Streptomyces sp. NBC_01317]|uniref:hypothetical protein n=1 Tax=Streptomyces sp. NBC_01317 TaxID=2903822 RepID=UPI002E134C6B|nr:hypothetical protein OG349_04520 [Streptomyces sp. NBC_01317]
MRVRQLLTGIALGATVLVGGAATAQAAPAAPAKTAPVAAATWQWTGEYYSAKSSCDARRSYFMAASNVYNYRCVSSGGLWGGQVYAD